MVGIRMRAAQGHDDTWRWLWAGGGRRLVAAFLIWGLGFVLPAAELWVIDPRGLPPAEQALLASLQGQLNRTNATLWLRGVGASTWVLEEVRAEGMTCRTNLTVWSALELSRDRVQGFITCSVTNASLNVATSLAGPRRAVVADVSLRPNLIAQGWRELLDVRGLSEMAAWTQFRGDFTAGVLVHQPWSKPLHLRDLAVARGAFTCFDVTPAERTRVVRELGLGTRVFGWGRDEHEFVSEVSAGGGVVIPSDWALNLSALARLPAAIPPRPRRPAPTPLQAGERVVAFVVTDGDNVQWLLNGFVDSPGFWASPQRGRFAVTWELAPALAQLAPRVCARLFRTASDQDDFIAGPSGDGYWFPSRSPDAGAVARGGARAMAEAQLELTTVLNSGGGMEAADVVAAVPGVRGVLYKDYAPYHKWRGAVRWSAGKPIISYRHLLWEQKRADGTLRPDWLPEGVAAAIERLPAGVARDGESFALINVHAWSFRDSGGPMGAIARTVERLPAGTRVVTATEFFALLGTAGK